MPAAIRWLEAPPAGWEELERDDPNAGPTHRPALLGAIAAALPGHAAGFVVVEERGALLGGAPVVVERRAGLHWIHALPFTLAGTPLARLGEHPRVDRAVAEALAARAAQLRAVGGAWTLLRPAGPEVDPEALACVPGETRESAAALVDLSRGVDAALEQAERRTRQEIATARARGLVCAEEPGALDEAYAIYAAQARRWSGHRPRSLDLLRRLLEGRDPAGRLFTVRDGRGLLAATLALVSEREWMPWWSGSHPEARRLHAFPCLLAEVAARAAARGATRMNLGSSAGREGVAAFKHGMGARDQRVTVRWIAPTHAGVVGRAIAALQARLRAGRARGAPA